MQHQFDEGLDADGRRRYLTVLFSDLSGSTRLGELMQAESYAETLSHFRQLCREIIPRHGGRIARIQGDGVLAFFGYPETREDDGRRATEAALELHAAVSRLSVSGPGKSKEPLTLHSGIHAGLVLLADGDIERGRFEVLGDVPNVAARLSSMAELDDIYVSEETLGPQVRFFTTSERTLVSLKGRSAPLAVLRVLGRSVTHDRVERMQRRSLSPLVNRKAELLEMRDRLRKTIVGATESVVLTGGPGMGKTRLVDELRRHATAGQCLFLQGNCESYLSAEPLQPYLQMLRTLFGSSPQQNLPKLPSHPAVLALQGSEAELSGVLAGARQLVILDGQAGTVVAGGAAATLRSLFDALAARQPLMLVLDDWQWADEASQQVLDILLALRRPIFALILTRASASEGLLLKPTATIELRPLDGTESARAVEHLLPGADPFVISEIHRYAGGNPLYIEELCHSASAQGAQWLKELRLGSTAWLTALIESRVERLPPAQVELVRTAAVLGNIFPAWLLERITGRSTNDPDVAALAERDFIFAAEQPGMLRFKHGITRNVIYNAVGLHRREQMHRQVSQVLQTRHDRPVQESLYEVLAYHCAAGGLPEPAARYAELAGDKAMAACALDRARAQYSAALSALDDMVPQSQERALRWCGVAQKLALACVFDPLTLADGVETFERGLSIARDSGNMEMIARAEYWLGYICYSKGMSRDAIAHCEEALDLSTLIGETRLAAQVRATLGQALLSACEYDRALVLLDSAVEGKRRQSRSGGLAVGSAYTLACKGYLLGDRGRFALAEECFAEALQLLNGSQHQVASSVRHWISVVCLWQGRWEQALRVAEEAAEIAEHVKSRQQLAMGRALAGYARWILTRHPQGLQAVRDATSWIEARKGGLVTSLNHGWLVDGAVATGRAEEARRHAARLFARVRKDDRLGEAMGCRALARAAAKVNDFPRAERYIARALHSAEVRGSEHEIATTWLCSAQIELGRGRSGEAHRLLDLASAAFESMDMRWHLERASQARKML